MTNFAIGSKFSHLSSFLNKKNKSVKTESAIGFTGFAPSVLNTFVFIVTLGKVDLYRNTIVDIHNSLKTIKDNCDNSENICYFEKCPNSIDPVSYTSKPDYIIAEKDVINGIPYITLSVMLNKKHRKCIALTETQFDMILKDLEGMLKFCCIKKNQTHQNPKKTPEARNREHFNVGHYVADGCNKIYLYDFHQAGQINEQQILELNQLRAKIKNVTDNISIMPHENLQEQLVTINQYIENFNDNINLNLTEGINDTANKIDDLRIMIKDRHGDDVANQLNKLQTYHATRVRQTYSRHAMTI